MRLRPLSCALSILVAIACAAVGAHAACPTPFELEVTHLVNAERAQAGLAPLQIDDRLTASAQAHARDMAQNDFFSHTGSNGSRFNERIRDEGYDGGALAENIAAGYSSPAAVVDGWMNSAGHRANILNASMQHIGVGHVQQSGTRYGQYWSQSFGGGAILEATCGGSGSNEALARCQGDQLRAIAKLCRGDLTCRAQDAKRNGSADAAAKLTACLDRRRAGFERSYDRAIERAARSLAICSLSDAAGTVAAALAADAATLTASVTTVEANPHDARLRSTLIRETARLCGAALAAEARHVRKPDAGKLGDKRAKARARFDARAQRALEKGAGRGVTYSGAGEDALGDAAETLADSRVQTTSP